MNLGQSERRDVGERRLCPVCRTVHSTHPDGRMLDHPVPGTHLISGPSCPGTGMRSRERCSFCRSDHPHAARDGRVGEFCHMCVGCARLVAESCVYHTEEGPRCWNCQPKLTPSGESGSR